VQAHYTRRKEETEMKQLTPEEDEECTNAVYRAAVTRLRRYWLLLLVEHLDDITFELGSGD
jgi:hypothetical protein